MDLNIFKNSYLGIVKNLVPIFWETFLIFFSFVNEILFFNSIINWVIEWMNLIRLLMKESVFITQIVYFFYGILLGIFNIIIGLLLGVYKREDEINTFLLWFLLKIIYNAGFNDVLLEYFHDLSLQTNTAEQFYKFSLETVKQINARYSKIALKEPNHGLQIPLTIFDDPSGKIEIDFNWDESTNYQFKLFKFYRYID